MKFQVSNEADSHSYHYNLWMDYATSSDFRNHAHDEWSCEGANISNAWASSNNQDSGKLAAVFVGSGYADYLVFSRGSGTAWGHCMATTPELAKERLEHLKTLAPVVKQVEDGKVMVNFWAHTANGATSIRRSLDVPPWEEIRLNYTSSTLANLDQLIRSDYKPKKSGELYLWHGEPGTGKTTALRGMAHEWKNWAEMHYITDPEKFFGDYADYMLQVLIDSSYSDEDKWRLLILEDTGELLTTDAKVNLGQGLSRFLNAVDGLIGQGLRFVVLVTTNEELGKLNKAVSRPGRCTNIIEFKNLQKDEVVMWLKANKLQDIEVPSEMTLASLFAMAEQPERAQTKQKVGFGV